MNQQHSETGNHFEFEKYPELSEQMQEYACLNHFMNWTRFCATVDGFLLENARLRAELTALREKTIEIAGEGFDAAVKAIYGNTEGDGDSLFLMSRKRQHLDALRSDIISSSNKG